MEARNLERLVVVFIMIKVLLIGVHQNGVVGSRSGWGLVLSKEQLDWGLLLYQPKDPVYVEDKEVEPSKKDSDKDLAGKLDPKKR